MQSQRVILSAFKSVIHWPVDYRVTFASLIHVSTPMKIQGMFFYFSALTSMSAKGGVVPGHIGCLHVYKVNINPEIDTKGNRLMRLDMNSEQDSRIGAVFVSVAILSLLINLCALMVAMCVCYLSAEMPKCLLSSPHRS